MYNFSFSNKNYIMLWKIKKIFSYSYNQVLKEKKIAGVELNNIDKLMKMI